MTDSKIITISYKDGGIDCDKYVLTQHKSDKVVYVDVIFEKPYFWDISIGFFQPKIKTVLYIGKFYKITPNEYKSNTYTKEDKELVLKNLINN